MPMYHACVHESGHAVVAEALGVTVHSIDTTGDDVALCTMDMPERWEDEALVLMSGFLAACHVVPASLHHGLWAGAERDRGRLGRLFRRQGVSKAQREAFWDRAGELVTESLPAILLRADGLMAGATI